MCDPENWKTPEPISNEQLQEFCRIDAVLAIADAFKENKITFGRALTLASATGVRYRGDARYLMRVLFSITEHLSLGKIQIPLRGIDIATLPADTIASLWERLGEGLLFRQFDHPTKERLLALWRDEFCVEDLTYLRSIPDFMDALRRYRTDKISYPDLINEVFNESDPHPRKLSTDALRSAVIQCGREL